MRKQELGTALLKKSVHDLLFLAHKFLALLQAAGLAFDVDYSAVVQDTIQNCGGNGDVGKDLVPLGERLGLFLAPALKLLALGLCEQALIKNSIYKVAGQKRRIATILESVFAAGSGGDGLSERCPLIVNTGSQISGELRNDVSKNTDSPDHPGIYPLPPERGASGGHSGKIPTGCAGVCPVA